MKKLILLFCLFFTLTQAHADIDTIEGQAVAGGAATYLLSESFDSTGYDNTWSEAEIGAGTANEDCDNICDADAPLDGTYSLYLDASTDWQAVETTDFTAQANLYVYTMYEPGVWTGSFARAMISVETSDDVTLLARADKNADETVDLNCGGTLTNTGVTLSAGTTYHIWLEFEKNTACRLYISTTTTKGTADATDNSNAPNNDAGMLKFYVNEGDNDEQLFDKVRIDDVAIGDNPS